MPRLGTLHKGSIRRLGWIPLMTGILLLDLLPAALVVAEKVTSSRQWRVDLIVIDVLKTHGPLECPPVLRNRFDVDAGMVSATLANVLENAVDACAAGIGGKQHRIDFNVRPDGSDIIFEVIDNGRGMDPKTQADVFHPDFTSQKEDGSGLGLFLTSQILKRNNGDIRIQSQAGRGTTVTIRLPMAASLASRPNPNAEVNCCQNVNMSL